MVSNLKQVVIVVCSIIITLVQSQKDLCLNSKINKTCMCYNDVFGEDHKPYFMADCSGISLTTFPNRSQYPENIQILDLSFNKIQILDQNHYVFATKFLKILHLQHNAISDVDDEFFAETPNLIELDLSFNNITELTEDVFLDLVHLETLKLRYNRLTTLSDGIFSKMSSLKILDIGLNFLADFLINPKYHNGFISKLGLNKELLELNLENIGLKDNDNNLFTEFTNLTKLILSDNLFNHVPKMPYTVEYLDISGNNFTQLSHDYLYYHSLKVLKLDRLKKLTYIDDYTFYNLVSLEELSITECRKLKELNEDVFGNLSSNALVPLKKLVLSGNNLKTLSGKFEKLFDRIEFLDFSNNPWVCDCDILWMKKYYQDRPRYENICCAAPADLAGKVLNQIKDEEIPECFPEKYGKRSHRIIIPTLIILVLLLVFIIILLIKFAPSYKRFQDAGPESPYNLTSVKTSDEEENVRL